MGLACLSLPATDLIEEFTDMVQKAARQWTYEQRGHLALRPARDDSFTDSHSSRICI